MRAAHAICASLGALAVVGCQVILGLEQVLPSGFFDGCPIQVFDALQGAGAMHATVDDGLREGVRAC